MSRWALVTSTVVHSALLLQLSYLLVPATLEDPDLSRPWGGTVRIEQPPAPPPKIPICSRPPQPRVAAALPEVTAPPVADMTIPERFQPEVPDIRLEPLFAIQPPPETDRETVSEEPTPEPTPEPAIAASTPGEVESTVVAPQLRSKIKPVYPRRCQRRGHEGVVVLRLTVNTNGQVEDVTIVEPGPCVRLDQAAVRTAQSLQYEPATRAGDPVVMETELRVRFRLEDRR